MATLFFMCVLFPYLLSLSAVRAVSDIEPFEVRVCSQGCKRDRRNAEQNLAEQMRALVEHYKQADPVGLPGAPIPDPVNIPDMKQSFTVTTMNFKSIKVHGLSKFRFQHIRADLAKLEMAVGVRIDTLFIHGTYAMSGWFSRSSGPFTVTLTGVFVDGLASLIVDRSGKLTAEDIHMNIRFETIKLDFQNLGGMAYLFQGIINSVGTFLFDSVKPFILSEVNTRIRADINSNIDKIPQRFPNSIPPLDMAIAEARSVVRQRGYDPFRVDNFTQEYGGMTVSVSHVWVTGLATFYRLGEVSLGVMNNTANATVMVGTQRIAGGCHWDLSLGWASRGGTAKFWADYLQARVSVLQPLNVQRRPRIESLALKLGNIQARVDGSGTLDYVAEFALNVLPNVLRYQIVSLAEEPLRQSVQEQLNKVDVEHLIMQRLDALENKPSEGGEEGEATETGHIGKVPDHDILDYDSMESEDFNNQSPDKNLLV